MRGLLWLPLLALTAGCWQPRYFVPRENVTGTSPEGVAAAVYRIEHPDDVRTRGEVRIWSGGAEARYVDGDKEVVDLHVAFELENNGEVALELQVDRLALEDLQVDGVLQEPLGPASFEGRPRAEPGTTTRVDAVFRPPTTYPSDVDSFAVRFGVRFAVRDGFGTVNELTPFAPAPRSTPGYGYYGDPYRDPYWGDPFWGTGPRGPYGPRVGWGYGWGAGYGYRCW